MSMGYALLSAQAHLIQISSKVYLMSFESNINEWVIVIDDAIWGRMGEPDEFVVSQTSAFLEKPF